MAPRRSRKKVVAPPLSPEREASGKFVAPAITEDAASGVRSIKAATDAKRLMRARAAIERSKLQEPGLSRLATVIARKPIKVVITAKASTSSTDGSTIWLKPDISLGAEITHKGRLCGQRDPETELQLCPACARVDESALSFFHEAGHVILGSFDTMEDPDIINIMERTIAERGRSTAGTREAKLLAMLEREKSYGRLTYLRAADVISPYLPMLVNCLEDARVNAGMYAVRPGLEVIFRSDARRIFVEGIAKEDGSFFHWSGAGPNAQAMIGTYLLAAGYGQLVEQLSPDVQKALKNPRLRLQLMKIERAVSIETVYSAAFPVLEALREEGFCTRHDDPKDDPPPRLVLAPPMSGGSSEEGAGAEGESDEPSGPSTPEEDSDDKGAGGGAPRLEEAEPEPEPEPQPEEDEKPGGGAAEKEDDEEDEEKDDDASGGGSTEDEDEEDEEDNDDAGAGDDEEDDDEDDGLSLEDLAELLRTFMGHEADGSITRPQDEAGDLDYLKAAELQGSIFGDSSPNVYTLNLHVYGKPIFMPGGENRSEKLGWNPRLRHHAQEWDEDLGPMPLGALNNAVVKARQVFGANRAIGLTKGLRSGFVDSGRLAQVAAGKDNVFGRRVFPDERDYFAVIGLDISGSTADPDTFPIIRQLAGAMNNLFSRTGVKFATYAHTGYQHEEWGTSGSSLIDVDIFQIKSPTEPWGTMQKRALADLTWAAQNLDGHTLEFYRKVAEDQRQKVKLVFYLTDGAMPAENRAEEIVVLRKNVLLCRQAGIHLIGLGLGTDSPKEFGMDTIIFESAADLPRVMTEIGLRLRAVK